MRGLAMSFHEEATLQVEQILTILKDHLSEGDSVMISGSYHVVSYAQLRTGTGHV